jgi:FrmR/RcnR family transcriptional regulator, repressor of frmRAB operon
MSHTVRNKASLLARVGRIRGQVEALERALQAEKSCAEIMQQIAAVRGAASGLMTEVIEEHLRTHVASPSITSNAARTRGADELIEVVRAYVR